VEKKNISDFTGVLDGDGKIAVPDALRKALTESGAGKIHVRVSPVTVNAVLKTQGVTEEEIDHLCNAQLETREQVVKFLLSEGALKGDAGFRRRAKALHA